MRQFLIGGACCLLLFAALLHGQGSPPPAQDPTAPDLADFRVRVWGDLDPAVMADFDERVHGYAELRAKLEQGLPGLVVTLKPEEIDVAERLLARRIRAARAKARRGAIFTPTIGIAIKKLIALGTTDDSVEALRDDNNNPDGFEFRINGTYPKEMPLSTVPATVLALLPVLPEDVEYRFVGRRLILRDTRANVIIDELRDALRLRPLR